MLKDYTEHQTNSIKNHLYKRMTKIKKIEKDLNIVLKTKNLNLFKNSKFENVRDKDKFFIFKEVVLLFIKNSYEEMRHLKYSSQFIFDSQIEKDIKDGFLLLKSIIQLTLDIETDYKLYKEGSFFA